MQIADVPAVQRQLQKVFDFAPENTLCVSAKTGLHIETILPEVIRRIPSPQGHTQGPTRLRVFDSWFDPYRGVVCLVQVVDGQIRTGDKIESVYSGRKYEAVEVGIMHPERVPASALYDWRQPPFLPPPALGVELTVLRYCGRWLTGAEIHRWVYA